jgi:AraC-like DNA-binding protein
MPDSDLCTPSARANFTSVQAIVIEHTLPAVQALYLAELAKRWSVTLEDLLEGSGVDAGTLTDPASRIPVATAVELIERARRLTGEPALGYYLGLQMRVSMHGYLGFAALSAPTVRAATDLMVQFAPIVTTALSMRLRVDGREASIIVEEHADFGPARDVVLLATLVGIWQMGQAGTGRDLRGGSLDVAMPTPAYSAKLSRSTPRIRFDQPTTRLVFDAARLDVGYVLADPVALRLAREQCERELNALGLDGRLVARVRSLVGKAKAGFPSLQQVATALHTSPRTLKRQLAAEGHSFSSILEEERKEAATLLLRARDVTIEQVASRLGYSNVQNFARAFRRWTGATPADYRDTAARHGTA